MLSARAAGAAVRQLVAGRPARPADQAWLGPGWGVDEGRFPVWAPARLAWAQAVVGEVLVGGPLGRMPRQG
ncbi:MAG TPA: hypothetical protein VFM91_11115 [Propionibacteriaceae bacterium]|nr:hypothetical protein [Propionibacteriaceae bacterium]